MFGDIEKYTVQAQRLALFSKYGAALFANPANPATGMADAVVEGVGSSGGHRFVDAAIHQSDIIRINDAGVRTHPITDEIAGRIAAQDFDAIAQGFHAPLFIQGAAVDGAGHIVHQRTNTSLAGL